MCRLVKTRSSTWKWPAILRSVSIIAIREVFPEPHAFNYGSELVKVPSLDGAGKMSKSENQYATIYLADDDERHPQKNNEGKNRQRSNRAEQPNAGLH